MDSNALASSGAGLANTAYANFSVEVPRTLQFKETRRGLAARRTPVKIRTDQQTYSSNKNKLVRFSLPNDSLYDTRYGYMTFTMTMEKTGGTYCRMHSGIFSCFNRMRFRVGSTDIEDVNDYNRIYNLQWQLLNPPEVTGNIGVTVMGFGTQADRNALFPTAQYACPISSGVLNTELLPFQCFNAGSFLEFYLEDGVNCMETDGSAPNFTIENPVLHIERLEIDPSYMARIRTMIENRGLRISYRTFNRFTNALTTGALQQCLINTKNSSMNGILNIFVNSSTISDPTVNDRFINWTPTPGGLGTLIQSQLQINGKMFPDEPIDTFNTQRFEVYQMYCRWIMKWNTQCILPIAPPVNNQAFQTTQFVQIDDLEAYPEEPELVNPMSTLSINQTLMKKFSFSGIIASNWQLDSYVESFQEARISRNGAVALFT